MTVSQNLRCLFGVRYQPTMVVLYIWDVHCNTWVWTHSHLSLWGSHCSTSRARSQRCPNKANSFDGPPGPPRRLFVLCRVFLGREIEKLYTRFQLVLLNTSTIYVQNPGFASQLKFDVFQRIISKHALTYNHQFIQSKPWQHNLFAVLCWLAKG